MKVYFVDEAGRKAAPSWEYIATPQKLQKLEHLLDNEWSTCKKVAELRDALDVLRSAPLIPSALLKDPYFPVKDLKQGKQDVYALVTAANFNLALQSQQLHTTPEQLSASLDTGMDVIQAMKLWNKVWDKLANGNGDDPLFWMQGVHRHQNIQKGIEKKFIKVEQFVPRNDFASTESFALFTGMQTDQGWQEGYLNTPGNLVPLSQAKLYDSLGAAESAMSRSGSVSQYSEVQIVRLNMAVAGIESVSKSSQFRHISNVEESCIQTVASDVQKQIIETALQQASDEQLREQWEERQSPSIKRKM